MGAVGDSHNASDSPRSSKVNQRIPIWPSSPTHVHTDMNDRPRAFQELKHFLDAHLSRCRVKAFDVDSVLTEPRGGESVGAWKALCMV